MPDLPVRLLKLDRDDDFELAPRTDTLLVQKFISDRSRVIRRNRHRPHRLVLGKGLLGEQRAWKIQLAARPAGARAERTNVAENAQDFGFRQRVAKRGHHAIEGPHRPAAVDDCQPVSVRLGRRETAVGEIRDRSAEPHSGLRQALAVRDRDMPRRRTDTVRTRSSPGPLLDPLSGTAARCQRSAREVQTYPRNHAKARR